MIDVYARESDMAMDQISQLFTAGARKQRYLDVEAALAEAQAELGVIPADAAVAIGAVAHLEQLDRDRMAEQERITGHPLMPLINELARAAGPEAGGWVHWGATTQNIQQTGEILGLRDAHVIITAELGALIETLADLGDRTAHTLMPGRTHWQHAVPITFGFKVASWIDVLIRHLERLDQLTPRLLTCMTGGAVGTFATLGDIGPAVQDGVAERLGLSPMPVPARNIVDHLAELVCVLGLTAATTGSIGEELSRLMSTEYGEISEPIPDGDIGSSTMPQKRNPKLCGHVVTTSALARAAVPIALEAMIQSHEVDGAKSVLMDTAMQQACVNTVDAVHTLTAVLTGLEVFGDRMRRNLDLTGGLISSEAVMMTLAATLGRQDAHSVVHEAAHHVAMNPSDTFAEALAADPHISAAFSAQHIRELLDPARHTGLAATIAVQTTQRARRSLQNRTAG